MNFFRRFFRRTKEVATTSAFAAPQPQAAIYVVGDIHGRADLLEKMLGLIEADKAMNNRQDSFVVFVGDLIDRGDSSRAVMQTVSGLTRQDDTAFCVMGNHEKMLLDFLEKPEQCGELWITNGGRQTLESFGISNVTNSPTATEYCTIRDQFSEMLSDGLLTWIRGLPLWWKSGNLYIVHANADPLLSIEEQEERTLLWGRGNYNRVGRKDGNWIAHGHTIVDQPSVANGRISVDTGAYVTGRLTAAVVATDGSVKFLST